VWHCIGKGWFADVDHLNELDLSPAHKLELACMYTIPQWVAPAICTLILSPLSIISKDDTHRLGLWVYSINAKAHEVIVEAILIYVEELLLQLTCWVECTT